MKKRTVLILQGILFVFLMVYFTQISPLQPFDGDDWRYIGSFRLPLPLWGVWNPTRVLPETLMPLGGYLGAFVIYPIFGHYLWALSFAEALIVSFFIISMLYLFYNLLVKKFSLNKTYALAGEILFFLSCFLLFKQLNQPSFTAFWTVDLSCDFYYLIPGLLNASVIFYILQYDNFIDEFRQFSNLKKGLFILAVYFAIFSSTQLNIILATFAALMFLNVVCSKRWIGTSSITKNIKLLFSQSWVYVIILFFWLVSVVFELSGQRATSVGTNGSLGEKTQAVFKQFDSLLQSTNQKFLLISGLIILVTVIIEIVRYRQQKKVLTMTFLKVSIGSVVCLFISFVYLFIAYTKAGDMYASRPDAMWAVVFFFLFAANLSFIYIFRNVDFVKMMLPLLLVLEALIAFNFNCPSRYPTNSNHDGNTISRVNNYIIDQIQNADREGKAKVVVKVPYDNDNADPKNPATNWPHSYMMGTFLQDTLYNHHLIRTRMRIIFKPDKSVTHKLYENEHQQPLNPVE